jgi:phenylalanyl-tRNA synthetase beta chain
VLFELELEAVLEAVVPEFHSLPRQQGAMRDLALVVRDDVPHDGLMAALKADTSGLVRQATLFDVFKPAAPVAGLAAGERSLAVRLELRDDGQTLTDERIEAAVDAAVARAAQACGARLRA